VAVVVVNVCVRVGGGPVSVKWWVGEQPHSPITCELSQIPAAGPDRCSLLVLLSYLTLKASVVFGRSTRG